MYVADLEEIVITVHASFDENIPSRPTEYMRK